MSKLTYAKIRLTQRYVYTIHAYYKTVYHGEPGTYFPAGRRNYEVLFDELFADPLKAYKHALRELYSFVYNTRENGPGGNLVDLQCSKYTTEKNLLDNHIQATIASGDRDYIAEYFFEKKPIIK